MYVNDFNGFGAYGSWLDSVKSAVTSVAGKNTIAYKLASGDVQGAIKGAGGMISGGSSKPATPNAQQIAAARLAASKKAGFTVSTPLLLGGVGLLVVALVLRKRRG